MCVKSRLAFSRRSYEWDAVGCDVFFFVCWKGHCEKVFILIRKFVIKFQIPEIFGKFSKFSTVYSK